MKHPLPMGALALVLTLGACAGGTVAVPAAAVSSTLDTVRLFCAVRDSVVALSTVSGGTVAPVIAKGASSAYVAAACAVAGGFAVSPPAVPGAAPVLVIPAQSIPLKS